MKISKDRFLELSKEVHGDKYDYSLVEYRNTSTKVKIICPEHGEFFIIPKHHYKGSECQTCSSNRQKLSLSEFIERSNELHNNWYDYSKFEYINSRTKSTIICPKHGEFEQSPNHHLSNRGCKECGKTKKFIGTEEFIKRSNKVHGNKYDYSSVNYMGALDKVIIICPTHGEFKQEASSHLRGTGCHKCFLETIRKSLEDFIEECNSIHSNKYDYSLVEYVNNSNEIKIICPSHGEFMQIPHVHKRSGCPTCKSSLGELKIFQFLSSFGLSFEQEFKLDNGLRLDFYIPNNNVGIEYDGKQHFEVNEFFGGEKGFEETKDRDSKKDKFCSDNNIKLIRIPYWDFDNIEDILKKKLKL